MRSGYVDIRNDVLGASGNASYAWSSMSNLDSGKAYLLYIASDVMSSAYEVCTIGFPLRCLAS